MSEDAVKEVTLDNIYGQNQEINEKLSVLVANQIKMMNDLEVVSRGEKERLLAIHASDMDAIQVVAGDDVNLDLNSSQNTDKNNEGIALQDKIKSVHEN